MTINNQKQVDIAADGEQQVNVQKSEQRKLSGAINRQKRRRKRATKPTPKGLAPKSASEQTIMAIAGHVSRRMLERYSHIRMEAKRTALEALSGKKLDGCGTIYGTNGEGVPTYTDLNPSM